MASKWATLKAKKGGIVDETNSSQSVWTDDESNLAPIRVNLGGNRLVYEHSSWLLGKSLLQLRLSCNRRCIEWTIENSAENEWREKVGKLEKDLKAVHEENQIIKEKLERVNEESNLVKFKNQLLIEMVG